MIDSSDRYDTLSLIPFPRYIWQEIQELFAKRYNSPQRSNQVQLHLSCPHKRARSSPNRALSSSVELKKPISLQIRIYFLAKVSLTGPTSRRAFKCSRVLFVPKTSQPQDIWRRLSSKNSTSIDVRLSFCGSFRTRSIHFWKGTTLLGGMYKESAKIEVISR